MPRFVALLRGVSPQNCRMADLKQCLENAGMKNVHTILSSGNVAFDIASTSETTVQQRVEKAIATQFDRAFFPIIRTPAYLAALVSSDPYPPYPARPGIKRVVSFLRSDVKPKLTLPLAEDGATVLCQRGREVFTVYVPSEKGPVFMKLIERGYGSEITTRTWDTVVRCAAS
jgi:uncharacterized protein (DUF1697 family)